MKAFKFKGIKSSDGESFVWAVTKEDYIKVTGNEPCMWDENGDYDGMYNLYPYDLYETYDEEIREVEIIIK